MFSAGAQPQDAQTVAVRVQVIDVESRSLDVVLPTYIHAADLTQRIARDAGLGAYWDDGTRRNYWLRARGRVLQDNERLQDLGVGDNELLHLLPQPPTGTQVIEHPADFPEIKGYAAAGWFAVGGSLLLLTLWTIGFAWALTSQPGILLNLLPPLGLGLLSTSFSRHLWGGSARLVRVPLVGFAVYAAFLFLAAIPGILLSSDPTHNLIALLPGATLGILGVFLSWLAWYGAVDPIGWRTTQVAKAVKAATETLPQCGICGQDIELSVLDECQFKCGRVFHAGCYRTTQSMAAPGTCGVCGYTVQT